MTDMPDMPGMEEEEKWAKILDEQPVLAFLIQNGMVKLDLIEPDYQGRTGLYITESGWQKAFQILLAEILTPVNPNMTVEELVLASRKYALEVLVQAFEPLSAMTPEEREQYRQEISKRFKWDDENDTKA